VTKKKKVFYYCHQLSLPMTWMAEFSLIKLKMGVMINLINSIPRDAAILGSVRVSLQIQN
jgi:hypothetical protein